jgi:hypothetical protein
MTSFAILMTIELSFFTITPDTAPVLQACLRVKLNVVVTTAVWMAGMGIKAAVKILSQPRVWYFCRVHAIGVRATQKAIPFHDPHRKYQQVRQPPYFVH